MARSKSSWRIEVEYAGVLGLVKLMNSLPLLWAEKLARWTIKLVLAFMPKRRRIMLGNIARSFPDMSAQEHKNIAGQSLDNLALSLSEFVRMPELLRSPDTRWIHMEGLSHLENAIKAGKGVLPFTAHYGCWEFMSSWTLKYYPKVGAVYRPLDNPKIDALVKSIRCSGGGLMIDRHDILRQGLKWLKNNGVLGFLIDQNFAGEGVFVNFFGRPASTTPIISILARRTGAVVLPIHNRWEGRDLHIIWEKPMVLSQNPDVRQAVLEDTQLMTNYVERWIREDPGQWLWLHNRWKRQPT